MSWIIPTWNLYIPKMYKNVCGYLCIAKWWLIYINCNLCCFNFIKYRIVLIVAAGLYWDYCTMGKHCPYFWVQGASLCEVKDIGFTYIKFPKSSAQYSWALPHVLLQIALCHLTPSPRFSIWDRKWVSPQFPSLSIHS